MDIKNLLFIVSQPIADMYIGKKKIYLFALTSQNMSSIGQLNDEDNPVENFKSVFRIVASHRKPKKSNNIRTPIPDNFINSLTETELNKFAETYLETSYIKDINKKLKNPLQKNSNEEDIQYLYRLLKMYVKNHSQKNKEMITNLLDPFRNVREVSSILSKKIDTYDFSSPAIEQARTINTQRIQQLEMARVTAEMTKESTNLLNELAKAVSNFLDGWGIQTKKNNETTKKQLWIAAGSLFFSLVLSGVALYLTSQSYQQDKQNNSSNEKWQNDVIKLLRKDLDKNTKLEQELITTKIEVDKLKKDLAKLQNKKK